MRKERTMDATTTRKVLESLEQRESELAAELRKTRDPEFAERIKDILAEVQADMAGVEERMLLLIRREEEEMGLDPDFEDIFEE